MLVGMIDCLLCCFVLFGGCLPLCLMFACFVCLCFCLLCLFGWLVLLIVFFGCWLRFVCVNSASVVLRFRFDCQGLICFGFLVFGLLLLIVYGFWCLLDFGYLKLTCLFYWLLVALSCFELVGCLFVMLFVWQVCLL